MLEQESMASGDNAVEAPRNSVVDSSVPYHVSQEREEKAASEAEPVKETETETKLPETDAPPPEKTEAEAEGESSETAKRKGGWQRKIEALQRELETKNAELAKFRPAEQAQPAPTMAANEDGRPNPNDPKYATDTGAGEFFRDEALWMFRNEQAENQKKNEQQVTERQFNEKLNKVDADLKQANPQAYATVAELNQAGLISQPIREAIVDSPMAVDLAAHLAEYPETLVELQKMDEKSFYRSIGLIEAGLAMQKKGSPEKVETAVRTTNAPAPITPVKAQATTANRDPAKMSQAEFEEWLRS